MTEAGDSGGTPEADELECRELVEIVTDYLEDGMDPPERRRLEGHLPSCPFCTEYVEQMRTVRGELRELETSELDPERRASLLSAFRTATDR